MLQLDPCDRYFDLHVLHRSGSLQHPSSSCCLKKMTKYHHTWETLCTPCTLLSGNTWSRWCTTQGLDTCWSLPTPHSVASASILVQVIPSVLTVASPHLVDFVLNLALSWQGKSSWVTFLVSSNLVCQFLLVAQFTQRITKSVFLCYRSQRDVHLFCRFRMMLTWTKNIEKISSHDWEFSICNQKRVQWDLLWCLHLSIWLDCLCDLI